MANIFEAFRNRGSKILNGLRIKPNTKKSDEVDVDIDSELLAFLTDPTNDPRLEGIDKFRDVSKDRTEQYNAYDEMEKDASISAALKMYSDDATQYNLNGDVIWVESDDTNIASFGNRLLRKLRINDKAWSHIYSLLKYGDLYLETFYDDEVNADDLISTPVPNNYNLFAKSHKIGARIEEYVEAVPNPANIFDLKKRGKTDGYIVLQEQDYQAMNTRLFSLNLTGSEQAIMPADKYVHIMLGEEANRFPETFEIHFKDDEESSDNLNSEDKTYVFKVARGKSLLHDAFKAYRELKLMEDSVLLNRVTRSAITRVMQIEVGDMPRAQVKEKLRQIKMMIEQKNFMDESQGQFASQASPGPVDNIIYVPTRNGNGAITTDTIGGDVDPKSLIDLDYYKGKLAGALGVLQAYLAGESGDGGGLSSGTALTKLDNKYARAVKRIQISYIQGITTLLNIFAIRKNLTDYVNAFTVRMVSPSTIEDDDRDQQLDNRTNILSNIVGLLTQDAEWYAQGTIKKVIEYSTSAFLNKPEITEILEEDEQVRKEEQANEVESIEKEANEGLMNAGGTNFDVSDIGEEFDEITDEELPDLDEVDTEAPADGDEGSEAGTATDETNADFGDYEDFA